jgi:hypothetical protein
LLRQKSLHLTLIRKVSLTFIPGADHSLACISIPMMMPSSSELHGISWIPTAQPCVSVPTPLGLISMSVAPALTSRTVVIFVRIVVLLARIFANKSDSILVGLSLSITRSRFYHIRE